MATIKSYSDLQQSKKLAEILPIDTADMYWFRNDTETPKIYPKDMMKDSVSVTLPCWSLAALLDVLPKFIGDYGKCLYYDVDGYYCGYMVDGDFMLTIKETKADNFVDAYYEMIIRLNELNLL